MPGVWSSPSNGHRRGRHITGTGPQTCCQSPAPYFQSHALWLRPRTRWSSPHASVCCNLLQPQPRLVFFPGRGGGYPQGVPDHYTACATHVPRRSVTLWGPTILVNHGIRSDTFRGRWRAIRGYVGAPQSPKTNPNSSHSWVGCERQPPAAATFLEVQVLHPCLY